MQLVMSSHWLSSFACSQPARIASRLLVGFFANPRLVEVSRGAAEALAEPRRESLSRADVGPCCSATSLPSEASFNSKAELGCDTECVGNLNVVLKGGSDEPEFQSSVMAFGMPSGCLSLSGKSAISNPPLPPIQVARAFCRWAHTVCWSNAGERAERACKAAQLLCERSVLLNLAKPRQVNRQLKATKSLL
jgi:hypothetical protein